MKEEGRGRKARENYVIMKKKNLNICNNKKENLNKKLNKSLNPIHQRKIGNDCQVCANSKI